jgi:hypothetical protein
MSAGGFWRRSRTRQEYQEAETLSATDRCDRCGARRQPDLQAVPHVPVPGYPPRVRRGRQVLGIARHGSGQCHLAVHGPYRDAGRVDIRVEGQLVGDRVADVLDVAHFVRHPSGGSLRRQFSRPAGRCQRDPA